MRLWRRLLCRIGRHKWQLVYVKHLGHNWVAHHCQRCHWQSIGTPLDIEPRRWPC